MPKVGLICSSRLSPGYSCCYTRDGMQCMYMYLRRNDSMRCKPYSKRVEVRGSSVVRQVRYSRPIWRIRRRRRRQFCNFLFMLPTQQFFEVVYGERTTEMNDAGTVYPVNIRLHSSLTKSIMRRQRLACAGHSARRTWRLLANNNGRVSATDVEQCSEKSLLLPCCVVVVMNSVDGIL